MSRPSEPNRYAVLPAQVWVCLSADRRAQAIQLMAQLAFNLVKAQFHSPRMEATHVIRPNPQQDSPRPS
jgi:hypothetical protein